MCVYIFTHGFAAFEHGQVLITVSTHVHAGCSWLASVVEELKTPLSVQSPQSAAPPQVGEASSDPENGLCGVLITQVCCITSKSLPGTAFVFKQLGE